MSIGHGDEAGVRRDGDDEMQRGDCGHWIMSFGLLR
jgi:hypothetical protein